MTAYSVEALDDVTLHCEPPLSNMGLMSPFVWRQRDGLGILVRGVPCPLTESDPTGIIWAGTSSDGLNFAMKPKPAIVPGPDAVDASGVEDPTVEVADDGLMVFFTGVDAKRAQGSLLVASGPDLLHLTKREVALQAPEGAGNIKEATLAWTAAGDWRLFYEYARDNASRIGIASAPALGGSWTVLDDPFSIRENSWDNWHLSTGPIVQVEGQDPVMFYNGATVDARWRIGWISFDPDFTRVTDRGVEPLLVPPPAVDRAAIDIAFAASTLVGEDGAIHLYYSLEDRMLRRATILRYD